MRWRNWGRTVDVHPAAVGIPRSEDELLDILSWANNHQLKIRPRGAGHSFTPIAATGAIALDLRRFAGVRRIDPAANTVTVGAGSVIRNLHAVLWDHRLAFDNLGDIDTPTLAGAISTATHGTGIHHPGLAAQVIGLRIALADGRVVDCSENVNSKLFNSARAGLGAFGIITEITFGCLPAFFLRVDALRRPLDQILATFDDTMAASDHTEFYWFPHTDWTVVINRHRHHPNKDLPSPNKATRLLTEEVLGNGCFALTCALAARVPRTVPTINALAGFAMQESPRMDRSYRGFCTPRRVRFREMEYGLPRDNGVAALRDIRHLLNTGAWYLSFPIEVRTAPADGVWLSPAYQRDTTYIAVHRYHKEPDNGLFPAIEQILLNHGGRPHLGKLHTLTATELAGKYPRHADLAKAQQQLDPHGIFSSPYLRKILRNRSA